MSVPALINIIEHGLPEERFVSFRFRFDHSPHATRDSTKIAIQIALLTDY